MHPILKLVIEEPIYTSIGNQIVIMVAKRKKEILGVNLALPKMMYRFNITFTQI